jgi:ribosomal protein S18 acetylase RimI-like enzyme
VRRPWRRRGLAEALLHRSFAELYARGKRRVGLGVDADNVTGALRLYERVGMRAVRRYGIWQKDL